MKRLSSILFLCTLALGLNAQQWEIAIDLDGSVAALLGTCCNDSNETLLVGSYKAETAYAVKIDENGNYSEKLFTVEGRTSKFFDVITLSDGKYLVTGKSKTNDNDYLWVLVIDDNLDIITERFFEKEDGYEDHEFGWCRSMIDKDGTIVLGSGIGKLYNGNIVSKNPFFLRLNEEYECIDRVFISNEEYNHLFYSTNFEPMRIMNVPNSTDIIMLSRGEGNVPSVLRFDYNFNLVSHKVIRDRKTDETLFYYYYSDYIIGDDSLMLVSDLQDPDVYNEPYIMLGKVDKNGIIYERVSVNKTDTLNYGIDNRSMCTANDTTIYMISRAKIGSWAGPGAMEIYLCTKDLEILGSKSFYDEIDYWPMSAIATLDGGLVTISDMVREEIRIKKYLREDFNPIPCSVREVPKETLLTTAFPNPTHGELNIDISDIPNDIENRVNITDMHGVVRMSRIIRGNGNLLTIDVSSLEQGAYIVQITSKYKVIYNSKFSKINY